MEARINAIHFVNAILNAPYLDDFNNASINCS